MSDRTRALRYKRPALASMGAQEIMLELESIVEACDGIRYCAYRLNAAGHKM